MITSEGLRLVLKATQPGRGRAALESTLPNSETQVLSPVSHLTPLLAQRPPSPHSLVPLRHSSCNKRVCCSQEECVGFLIIHYNQPDWFCRRISRRWVFKMQIPPFRDPLESTEVPLVDPSMPWQFFMLCGYRSSEEPAGWLNLCAKRPLGRGSMAGWVGSRVWKALP